MSNVFPLFYTFREIIVGKGFIAGVSIRGRATATLEQEEGVPVWEFNGVEPGSFSELGATLNASYFAFKEVLRQILLDLATSSKNYEQFQRRVQGLVDQVNRPEEKDWIQAREAVRRGDLGSPLSEMEREENEDRATLKVTPMYEQQQATAPNLNPLSEASYSECRLAA